MSAIEDDDTFPYGPAFDGFLGSYEGMGKFANLPSPTAMAQLNEAGIGFTQMDLIILGSGMQSFQSFPNIHYSKVGIEHEKRIRDLSRELMSLLESDVEHGDGFRRFWGEVDWSSFEQTLEQPEPEWTIDVSELQTELSFLAKSAQESVDWLESTKTSDWEPGSNRAPRLRYFYWLLLIAFWKHRLGRNVSTCTNSEGAASGALIRFIQIMSENGMSADQIEGQTVRAFIRGNAGREDRFAPFFKER